MKQIEGGVTAAKGYTTAGTRAGIKKGKTNKDMAMIFSEKPAVTAGTFTKNLVKAAPVLWDKKVTDAGVAQAVVINTGIANACTGQAVQNMNLIMGLPEEEGLLMPPMFP